jgi:hypothetical protein
MIGRLFGKSDDPTTEADYATVKLPAGSTLDDEFGPSSHPNGFKVRPDEEHEGIDAGLRMLQGLHDARSHKGENISVPFVFEIRRIDGRVSFYLAPGDASKRGALLTQIEAEYPGAEVEEEALSTLHTQGKSTEDGDADTSDRSEKGNGDTERDRYVSASTLRLTDEAVRPIRHLDIEGFDKDPYNSVIQAMSPGEGERAGGSAADMIIQIVMRPCMPDWTLGPNGQKSITEVAEDLVGDGEKKTEKRDGELISWIKYDVEVEPSKKEEKAAKIVRNLANEDGWSLNVRIATSSEDEQEARDRTHTVGRMFRAYYESSTGQGFKPVPAGKRDIGDVLSRLVNRSFTDEGIWVSRHELAGLAHFPDGELTISSIERAYGSVKRGVPVGTPRFDYRSHGLEAAESTPAEKQATMCSTTDLESPFWYGWGTKHGVEAGIFHEIVDTHQFVGGTTGRGKTTLLKNFWRQVLSRGYGSMFIDPKGRDAGSFVDLVPEDREDDLVYIEIGGDRGRNVGFNFLEPSGDVEHGTPAYVDAVESCAEDLAAVLAEAGDADGDTGWGTRMDRITKNVVRGMARAPEPLTLLDMHYALSSSDQRRQYADMLADEQISWIEDYAQNQLAEMDDDVLEPLSGRLNQLIENDIVRNMITVRESSVSIEEIVREGKIIVVNNLTTSSVAKRLITIALIRRLWVAMREQTYNRDMDDPPAFFPIIDEFDSVVTERSNIHSILSEARAFGLCLTLACQAPSNQLPKKVRYAIENQCETFLSFDPGGPADAKVIADQHSSDVDYEDLLDLPKYRIMLRTHTDDGEKTPSYPVNAFPPLEAMAQEADLNDRIHARTEDERRDLINASLSRYGQVRKTDAEIKNESRFYAGSVDDDSVSADQDMLYKSAYDAQVRHSDDPLSPSSIQFDTLADALRDELARHTGEDTTEIHDGQIQSLKDRLKREYLTETRTDDGDYHYTVEPDGLSFLDQGTGPDVGKQEHRDGVEDGYHYLTHYLPNCRLEVPTQGGSDEAPDLFIDDPFGDELQDKGSALAISKATTQFEANNPIRAVLTGGSPTQVEMEWTTKHKADSLIGKVTRSYEADQACLFLVWSIDDARIVHRHLTSSEAQDELPDHDGQQAHWNILILPTPAQESQSQSQSQSQPHLYLAPDADPKSMPVDDVSPTAIEAAATSDLFDF